MGLTLFKIRDNIFCIDDVLAGFLAGIYAGNKPACQQVTRRLFADMADATLYVTRSGHTEKALIDFANKQIDAQKVKNVAFVLNDVNKDYFGYGNKYGYGYQAEEKKWWQKIFTWRS